MITDPDLPLAGLYTIDHINDSNNEFHNNRVPCWQLTCLREFLLSIVSHGWNRPICVGGARSPSLFLKRTLLRYYWGIIPFDHLQKVNQLLTQTKPYNTSPPLKRRDSRSAGYTGGPANIQPVSFLGYTGESVFQVRHGYSLKMFIIIVDGGIWTHDPKKT